MTPPEFDLKWGVRKRLEFIEFRLFWDGQFNRPDLREAFGISTQQATNDVSLYQKLLPDNCVYDKAQKTYVRGGSFQPNLIAKNVDRYLLQLVAIDSGWMEVKETWFANMPAVEFATIHRKPINAFQLLTVLDAIRTNQQLTISYESLTGSPAAKRIIAPHAITHSRGRWYVRAWNEGHNDFRDYHLNRIRSAGGLEPCTVDHALDYQWFQKINFVLAPNPALSQDKQRAVEHEYEMEDGVFSFPVRLSHAFYLIDEHNLDLEEGVLKPEKQQLVLQNREDVIEASRLARQMAVEALRRSAAS